jgi:hypothetical protein
MNARASIRFGPDQAIEFSVPFASVAIAQPRAREWLDGTLDQFGCEPIRPTGKVLLLDKTLGIADAGGEKHFQRDPECGRQYAQAVSSALDRTGVQVDLDGRTVSLEPQRAAARCDPAPAATWSSAPHSPHALRRSQNPSIRDDDARPTRHRAAWLTRAPSSHPRAEAAKRGTT